MSRVFLPNGWLYPDYRRFRAESMRHRSSWCPKCKAQVPWWHEHFTRKDLITTRSTEKANG